MSLLVEYDKILFFTGGDYYFHLLKTQTLLSYKISYLFYKFSNISWIYQNRIKSISMENVKINFGWISSVI